MNTADNQHAVGEKLYFFESSKPNENRCLVFAHGGHLWGDAADFALPAGITLSFNQKNDGEAFVTNPWRAMFHNGQPRNETIETFVGPTRVKDYSLGKGVGRHWEGNTITYEEIGARMRAQIELESFWTPHIVTVRRRFRCMGRLISLSQLVNEVVPFATARGINITHFYIAACRGDHSNSRFVSTMARI